VTREIDEYAEWDAAYLFGALSPNERREFERHLAECASCSRSVAELAGLPALLALVPAEQVVPAETRPGDLSDDVPAETHLAGLVSISPTAAPPLVRPARTDVSWTRLRDAARRQHRRTRRLVVSSVLVAASALLAVALVLPALLAPARQQAPVAGPLVALSQVQPSALSAEVRLVPEGWGTRVEATCIYARSNSSSAPRLGYGSGAQSYALYVTDRSGVSRQVASWSAAPGSTVEPVGTTQVAASDIASVDIRSVATGQVLLDAPVNQ